MTTQFFSMIFNMNSRQRMSRISALLGMVLALSTVTVLADDIEDANKLVSAGKYAEALQKANDFLVKNPRDAQMRFLKGIILTEQNKSSEAIGVFSRLIEDYPSLPEPYNNLAALFAASGQYDRAQTALEKAIRLNPSYATAHENLGDLYVKLSMEQYSKALQIDARNAGVKSKLTVARNMMNGPAAPTVPDVAAKSAPPAKVIAPNTDSPTKAIAPNADAADVLNVINAWAAAWSERNVEKYLSFYSDGFVPQQLQSRQAWAEERRARIAGKSRITVNIAAPQVVMDGNVATAKFRQVYVSDRLTDKTMKTMTLEKRDGQWRIMKEQAG